LKFSQTTLSGCHLIEIDVFQDDRGSFNKIYNEHNFIENGITETFKEQFYTVSNENVIRGMHFQVPPYDHCKLVTCLSGRVLDVILDLRKGSSSYANFEFFELSANCGYSIFIPTGFAHGFLSLESDSTMMYSMSTEYSPNHDLGLRWDSFGFNWPGSNFIISDRDRMHPAFESIITPF